MSVSFSWSAILLAGGNSTRMGKDKSTLQVNGFPLWKRQWDLLKELSPYGLFRSLRKPVSWGTEAEPVIWDLFDQGGPLVGIYSSLKKVATPYNLVLAVDMPNMQLEYLKMLIATAEKYQCGIIPRNQGIHEPLVGVYTKKAVALMETCIRAEQFALQDIIKALIEQGLVKTLEVEAFSRKFFENWNQPSDLTRPIV